MEKLLLLLSTIYYFAIGCALGADDASVIRKIRDDITIDGSLDDWKGHPYEVLGVNSSRFNSMTSVVYQGWSAEGLYVAIDVFDDSFDYQSLNSPLLSGDYVELFVDTRGIDYANRKPIARSGAMIEFDYFEVLGSKTDTALLIDDGSSDVTYSNGGWKHVSGGGHSEMHNGTASYVENHPGSWLSFNFHGDKLKAVCRRNLAGGLCDVIVDGLVVGRIDFFGRKLKPDDYRSNFGELFEYEVSGLGEGAHHVRFQSVLPTSEGVSKIIIKPKFKGNAEVRFFDSSGELPGRFKVASYVGDGRWSIECLLPWSELGVRELDLEDFIRFGYKVYDGFEVTQSDSNTLGLRREGVGTKVNWMVLNPERFPKFELGDSCEKIVSAVEVVEKLINGRSWILVDVRIPVSHLPEGVYKPVVSMEWSGGARKFEMNKSACSNFYTIRRYMLNEFYFDAKLKLVIESNSIELEDRIFAIPSQIKESLEYVEDRLPTEKIERIDEFRRGFVAFFKECALELSSFWSNSKNSDIMHYNHLPYFEDRALLQRDIDTFIERADFWMSEPIKEEEARFNRVQVWRSKADNSMQLFKLRLPIGFDPKNTYPVELRFHFLNKRLFSRTEWALVEIEGLEGLEENKVVRDDVVRIDLFGRGNGFRRLGNEEFEYVQKWVEEYLPNSLGDVRIFGSSVGAIDAIYTATRYFDLISLLSITGTPFLEEHLSPGDYDYGNFSQYLKGVDGIGDKLGNLTNVPIKQTVGGKDHALVPANISFYRKLKPICKLGFQFDAIAGAGHSIPRGREAALRIGVKSSVEMNRPFETRQNQLRYGSHYGVSARLKEKQWAPYELRFGFGERDGSCYIDTENLKALEVDFDRLNLGEENGVNLLLDEQEFFFSNASGIRFFSRMKGSWRCVDYSEVGVSGIKRPKLEGPIGDIEVGGFLIVYGTQDERSESTLFDRAVRIVSSRTGSDENQWSGALFEVKADSDVTENDILSKNLWLIGNVDENSIVSRVSHSFEKRGIVLASDKFEVGKDVYIDANSFIEFIGVNPLNDNTYCFVEAGLSNKCYKLGVLGSRNWDFSVRNVDGKSNPIVECGVFDEKWGLGLGGIKWRNEKEEYLGNQN